MKPVDPAVVRWLVATVGGALVAGVTAAMALEHVSLQTVLMAAGAAFGGALVGSLKTLPDTLRLSGVPGDIQDFIVGLVRNSRLPPLPATAPITPATPVLADVEQ